jgi:hypothetical protein
MFVDGVIHGSPGGIGRFPLAGAEAVESGELEAAVSGLNVNSVVWDRYGIGVDSIAQSGGEMEDRAVGLVPIRSKN